MSSTIRSSRYCTRINRAVPLANIRNAAMVAITRIDTPVVDSTGVKPSSSPAADRISTSVASENTNVATKMPSDTLVRRERTNTRTARGEYWLAASWIATTSSRTRCRGTRASPLPRPT